MKVIFELDISEDKDSREDLQRMTKSLDMALCLWDINEMFRKELKEATNDDRYHAIDIACEKFNDILYERGINIDEIIS